MRTSPWPWHASHVVFCVPGSLPLPLHVSQRSSRGIWIFVSSPAAASSSVIFSSYWRSSPRITRERLRRPPPALEKKFSKMSSKSVPKPPSKPPPAPVLGTLPKRS